jgi:hypothetical protein
MASAIFAMVSTALWCVAGAACTGEQTHFDLKFAPEFRAAGMTVSTFGVFKDGRMSPETWDDLGPRLSPALGAKVCEVAYGSALVRSKPTLAAAVDDYARANGVTDDLIEQFAPLANGDAILVITMAGETSRPSDAGTQPSSAPGMPRPGGRAGRGRRSMSGPPPDRHRHTEASTLEISATFFSVRLRRPVALISMTYSGTDLDAAIEGFRRKLETSMPGAVCTGWDRAIEVDEQRIRDKIEP